MAKSSRTNFDNANLVAWLDEHYPYGKDDTTRRHAYPAQVSDAISDYNEIFTAGADGSLLDRYTIQSTTGNMPQGDALKRNILNLMGQLILAYQLDATSNNHADLNPGYDNFKAFVNKIKSTEAYRILNESQGTATSFFQRFSSIFPRFSKTSSRKVLEEMLVTHAKNIGVVIPIKYNQETRAVTRADISELLNSPITVNTTTLHQ